MIDIQKNQKKLDKIFKENQIVLAYLYGSVARGKENSLSDIDIAVLFSKKAEKDDYFKLRIKISGEIDRLLKTDKAEVICLNQAPPFLKYESVYSGIIIYCLDKEIKRDFEFRVLQEYEDFKYHLNTASNVMKKQIKKGTFGKPFILYKSKYLEKYVSSK